MHLHTTWHTSFIDKRDVLSFAIIIAYRKPETFELKPNFLYLQPSFFLCTFYPHSLRQMKRYANNKLKFVANKISCSLCSMLILFIDFFHGIYILDGGGKTSLWSRLYKLYRHNRKWFYGILCWCGYCLFATQYTDICFNLFFCSFCFFQLCVSHSV